MPPWKGLLARYGKRRRTQLGSGLIISLPQPNRICLLAKSEHGAGLEACRPYNRRAKHHGFMRQNQNTRRSRGRAGKRSSGHPHSGGNRSIDSNGPKVKVRGSAMQLYEKYQALAREAQRTGNRIAAENLLQHAEHYYRVVGANGGGKRVNNTRHDRRPDGPAVNAETSPKADAGQPLPTADQPSPVAGQPLPAADPQLPAASEPAENPETIDASPAASKPPRKTTRRRKQSPAKQTDGAEKDNKDEHVA